MSTLENHTSATQFESHIENYIAEEIQHGAIHGPFSELPFKVHVSPLMTREKMALQKEEQ